MSNYYWGIECLFSGNPGIAQRATNQALNWNFNGERKCSSLAKIFSRNFFLFVSGSWFLISLPTFSRFLSCFRFVSRFESKMGYLLTCVIVLTSGCVLLQPLKFQYNEGIFILAIPPPWGWGVLAQLKNREEFGGLKRKGKGEKRRKKEKSDKIHVKIPLYSLNYRKKSTKSGKNFRGGGGFFWLARIYIPVLNHGRNMHSWSSRIDHSMELVLDISPVLNWFPSFRCLLCLWNIFSFSLCQWIIVAFFSYKCCYFGSSGFSLNKRNAHFSLYNSKHALMKIIRVSNFNYIPLHFHHFFSQTIISNIVLEMSCQSEFLIQVVPEKNDLFTVYSLPSP